MRANSIAISVAVGITVAVTVAVVVAEWTTGLVDQLVGDTLFNEDISRTPSF